MIFIENYISNLRLQNEIWRASEFERKSYPTNGNNAYYEIEDQSFWFENRNKIVIEAIRNYSISGPIFDVGGGNGFVSNYLDKSGFETVLVEPGIEGCLNAKERGLRNIINSNFDTTHFYPNSIPNICIFDVLEHVENQHQFLKTLHTNLAPDGRLFITVPSYNILWSEEDKQVGHYRRYRIKELQKVVDICGFEPLYVSYFFSFLVLPIFLFRTIPSLIGFYKTSNKLTKGQHLTNSGANSFLDKLMKYEYMKIKKRRSICVGSSILLIARKR